MQAAQARLVSVDALRGCTVAAMLLVNDPGDWGHVYAPLEHAAWNGCTPTDLVFPFFLFVMGVSAALAIEPRLEHGADVSALRAAALRRAARIVGLGLLINLLAAWWMPGAHMRVPGVLQRIGVCFAGVALFALHTRPRTWAIAIAVLLAGYASLLALGGSLAPWDNLASRVDSAVFGSLVYRIDPASGRGHDPEGLLSTLPSLATALFGLCAGHRLRAGATRSMPAIATTLLALGWAWSWWQPLNKNLWTPSFALWTAGWALLALWAFHRAIDVHGAPAPGRRFGVNAIAAYAGSELVQIVLAALHWQRPLYRFAFADWMTPACGPWLPSLAYAIVFVALWWGLAWWLDRRRLYLKL